MSDQNPSVIIDVKPLNNTQSNIASTNIASTNNATKQPFIKSPIFIGICIVIGLIIIAVVYYMFIHNNSTSDTKKGLFNRQKNNNTNLLKINIKPATNDTEINNLVNNINSSL
jgi:hypothetical protein